MSREILFQVSGVGQRSNQNNGVTLVSGSAAPRRQRPQLRVAKTCLVATVVRFSLWSPYVVHLVRLSLKQAFGLSLPGEVNHYLKTQIKILGSLHVINKPGTASVCTRLRLKNGKRTSKCQVFFCTVPKKRNNTKPERAR